MAQLIADTVIVVALLVAAVLLELTGHDAQLVWGLLAGYLTKTGVVAAARQVASGP
jgi:uncharacterized transporter YbjL